MSSVTLSSVECSFLNCPLLLVQRLLPPRRGSPHLLQLVHEIGGVGKCILVDTVQAFLQYLLHNPVIT